MALRRFTEAGLPDPIKDNAVVFFDDFTDEWALTSSEPVTGTSPWIGTALSSGTTAFSTDNIGGICVLANDTTNDNSGSQIQADTESFLIQASKDMVFGTRFKVGTDTTNHHFYAGLGNTHTAFLDGADGTSALTANATACLGFFVADGAATLYLIAKNGASTVVGQTAVATLAADTWTTAEYVMNGESTAGNATIEVFINGIWVARTRYTGMSTTEMTPTLAFVSGAAGAAAAQSATFDWVACAAER